MGFREKDSEIIGLREKWFRERELIGFKEDRFREKSSGKIGFKEKVSG